MVTYLIILLCCRIFIERLPITLITPAAKMWLEKATLPDGLLEAMAEGFAEAAEEHLTAEAEGMVLQFVAREDMKAVTSSPRWKG